MTAVADRAAAHGHSSALRDLWGRFAASDPAFSRFRLASGALLAVILSGGLLAAFGFLVHGLPPAAFGLVFVISFSGTMAVRDKTPQAQLLTRAYAFVGSVMAISAAALLAPLPILADIVFLIVIFVAVYIRQFSQRWFPVGMIGFMSYFIGDYLRPAPADLIWVALAALVSVAVTHLVTTVILPARPEHDFRRALTSIDALVGLIVRGLAEAAEQGLPAITDRRQTQKQLSRLRDAILMAEGLIPQGEDGSLAARGPASELAIALFDLQLAAERLVRTSYVALPRDELVAADRSIGWSAGTATDGASPLNRLRRARHVIASVLGAPPSPAFVVPDTTKGENAPPKAAKTADKAPFWHGLEVPVQVTLACGLAMGAGHLVSETRWYWAVITAFIVFNNTKSRADTAFRALQRSGGTLAGLIGGTLLATLLHGQLVASGIGILVFFFLAFYFLQASYSVMIFFITLGLALLYGVLGSFTPELLLERLEETIVGSLAGTLVAFVVFPTRASTNVGTAFEKYLDTLRDVLEAARGRARQDPEPLHLLARSRLLDRAYTELAAAVRPLGGPWNVVTRFGDVRQRLLWLTGATHWARVLARSLPIGVQVSDETRDRVEKLSSQIDALRVELMGHKDEFFNRAAHIAPPTSPPPELGNDSSDAVRALEVIAGMLERAVRATRHQPE